MYARYRVKTMDLVPSKWPSETEGGIPVGFMHCPNDPLSVERDLREVALDTRYFCNDVLMYSCTHVLMYSCTHVLMYSTQCRALPV